MILVTKPATLTAAETEAYEWAVDGLRDALRDEAFVRDNPGMPGDPAEQLGDVLYRLEQQADEMAFGCDEGRAFRLVAKRAAAKLRLDAQGGATGHAEEKRPSHGFPVDPVP